MELLSLILFFTTASLWFLTNEYKGLFGIYEPTLVMRRTYSTIMISGILILSIRICSIGDVVTSFPEAIGLGYIDTSAVITITLASLLTLSVLKFFSINGSSAYALVGSVTAYSIYSAQAESFGWKIGIAFLAAPVMAGALAAFIRRLLSLILKGKKIHLITLSYHLRHVVIICMIMTALAVGINWGGFICGIGNLILPGENISLAATVSIGIILMICLRFRKDRVDGSSGIFSDFSIYAVISTGFAVAIVLTFFSFNTTTSLIGLCPTPLSVSALMMAAIYGTESAQKSPLVESEEHFREIISALASPLCAATATYLLLFIINIDNFDPMADFIVLSAVITLLIALAFGGYARNQRSRNDATERLVNIQQQQIYEHSRALNEMEMKVVLSENQALHNAVEMKRQEVMNVALSIVEQREFLESLNNITSRLMLTEDSKETDRLITELNSSIKQRLSYERDVDSQYFYAQAESLHEDFNSKLSENFPNLTMQDKRLATLLRLGFSSKYIATLMNITPKSVEISRYRLRQKLGLGKGDNLVNFIKSI